MVNKFPNIFNYTALFNELRVYAAFFEEVDNFDYTTNKLNSRVWMFSFLEKSFLANKPVFYYGNNEATLYDYSSLLTIEIDLNHLDDFENRYGIKVHDLTKENLKVSEIKEILANNAKAAIRAENLTKQLVKFKSMAEDF